MTTVWNLGRLRYTVRKLVGKLDPSQIPDSSSSVLPISQTNPPGIDDYINDFYLYDLDEEMRTLLLKDFYYFETVPNVGTYNLPMNFFAAEPPIYVDGYQIAWYQSPDLFFRIWPQLSTIQNQIVTTDGINTTFTFTLQAVPVQMGTVSIGVTPTQTPVMESFSDSIVAGNTNAPGYPTGWPVSGALTGTLGGTGTINYITGAVSITFASVPVTGLSINAHYYPYVASRPRDCLFFQQQLNFKPIPNDVYQIKVMAYQQPTVFLQNAANQVTGTAAQFQNYTDVTMFAEWWQVVAYGAAMKILIEEGDHEEIERMQMYFEKAKLLAQRRALKQMSNQRIQTPYSDNNGGSTWPIFPFY